MIGANQCDGRSRPRRARSGRRAASALLIRLHDARGRCSPGRGSGRDTSAPARLASAATCQPLTGRWPSRPALTICTAWLPVSAPSGGDVALGVQQLQSRSAPRRASVCSICDRARAACSTSSAVVGGRVDPVRTRVESACSCPACRLPPAGGPWLDRPDLPRRSSQARRRAGSGTPRSRRRSGDLLEELARLGTPASKRPRQSARTLHLLVDQRGTARRDLAPSSSVAPWRIHCQTWAREISAVAASSIRL